MKASHNLQPDRIFYNGNLITMADCSGTAVAVLNGAICAVGSDQEIIGLAGPDTERTDLCGKNHATRILRHTWTLPERGTRGCFLCKLQFSADGTRGKKSMISYSYWQNAPKDVPEGQWVLGRGYDDTLLEEKRHPTRADLDRASQNHPICIVHTSGHFAAANTSRTGTRRRPFRHAQSNGRRNSQRPHHGRAGRCFGRNRNAPVRNLIPPLNGAQWFEGLEIAVNEYVREGVTSIVIAGCTRRDIARLQTAIDNGKLPLRVVCMTGKSKPGQQSILEASGLKTGFGTDRLRLGAVKMFQDGSIQGYTGYLSKPYHEPFMGDTQYRGYPMRSREALVEMVDEAHRAGKQIAIHGNGDAAIDDILSAYEQAQKKNAPNRYAASH